jgi:5-methylcytosine-specific restriction endonuclease McrA
MRKVNSIEEFVALIEAQQQAAVERNAAQTARKTRWSKTDNGKMRPSFRWMLERPGFNICTHCLTEKPVAEMLNRSQCRPCNLKYQKSRYTPIKDPNGPTKEYIKQHSLKDPTVMRAYRQFMSFLYRTEGKGVGLPTHPIFEETQLAAQGGCCFYCRAEVGDDYHLDHVIPVAHGGPHHPDNLVVACPTCNVRKSDLMPWEFKVDT